MTFKKLLLIFAILLSSKLKAQDTLYKTNGSKIIVKITEINSNEIKYKMLGSNSEIMVTENKSDVHHITYANGVKEFYNTTVQLPKQEPVDYVSHHPAKQNVSDERQVGETVYGKNIIAINFFETMFTNFGVSYERVSKDGRFSFKIPFSFGLGAKPNESYYRANDDFNIDYLKNKIYGTGLELNAYPLKFRRSAFYLGLTGEYGEFYYYSYGIPNGVYYSNLLVKYTGIHYAGLFHIGGNIGLTDNIILGGKMGLGYKHQETVEEDFTRFKMSFDLNLAYRF